MTFALFGLSFAAVVGIIVLGMRGWGHPFLMLLLCAATVGLAADMSFTYTIRSMTEGFSTGVASIGIVLVAGSIANMALDRSKCIERLAAMLADGGRGKRLTAFSTLLGFIGGLGAVGVFAFVLLMPLVRVLTIRNGQSLAGNALALALSSVATSTMLVPAPGPVAAAAILSADLWRTALWGGVVAVIVGLAGWAFSLAAGPSPADAPKDASPGDPPLTVVPAAPASRSNGIVALLPVLLPMALLLLSSAGHMPSAPFGGGPVAQMLPTLGQPMTLLLAAVVASLLASNWLRPATLLSEEGWAGRALASVAGLVLIIGAAGAFARVLQNAGLGEMLGEELAGLRIGILLPFAIAAAMKMAQGSSMLATITAAGFMQSLLGQVGLDDDTGRALCAVAIGAGAMVVSHANDSLFWVFTRLTGLSTVEGLRLLTLGTLVQGVVAAAMLVTIASAIL